MRFFLCSMLLIAAASTSAQPEPDGETWPINGRPELPIDLRAPIAHGDVAAPLMEDVIAPPRLPVADAGIVVQGPARTLPEPAPIDTSTPRDVAGAARVALLIAGLLRGLIWFTRQPLIGAFWDRLPMPARVAAIGAFTVAAAAADSVATGVNWPTALISAIFGASGAVASHELQQRILPSQKVRKT